MVHGHNNVDQPDLELSMSGQDGQDSIETRTNTFKITIAPSEWIGNVTADLEMQKFNKSTEQARVICGQVVIALSFDSH
jgi:hypothetical protein